MGKIVLRLKGGLGNQLFIYALGASISKAFGKSIFYDLRTGFLKDDYQRVPRIKELNTEIIESNLYQIILFYFTKKSPKLAQYLFKSIIIKEKSNRHFLEIPQRVFIENKFVFIDGYFQSFYYFINYQAQIFNEIRFSETTILKFKNLVNKIKIINSVSIHVRRVDYDNLLPIEYYTEAIKVISEKMEDPFFYVFSDDYEWCISNLSIHNNIQFINSIDELDDLYLMSQCKNHIIANSSFSWWGAMLGVNINKIVVAPIATQIGVVDKFYPSNWICI